MRVRATRTALLSALLAIGAVAAAGCFGPPPPPPPPGHTLCASAPAPGPGDHVALVAQGGTRPAVIKFHADTENQVQGEVDQLNRTGHVLAVGRDQPVHTQVVNPPGNNPAYAASQKDFQAGEVDFPAAWASEDGTGVRVAIVDTGVQADHPDLAGNVTIGNDLVFGNASSNFGRVDGYGHGSHVAGTVAAVDNTIGVIGGAPHATIVPVRVLDCQGSGSTSTVSAGVTWAADPSGGNAKVISMSLGGPGADPVLAAAIQQALSKGVVVVAAAGNCGDGSCGTPNTPEYPGAYAGQSGFQGLLAVGALDGTDPSSIHRASFSNSNTYVTVAAPGVTIDSTVPFSGPLGSGTGYGFLSGTSMATPHVSAVAALILQRCPNDTPAQVEARIVNGAQTLANPSEFVSGTVGMLRADAVVSGSCP